MNDKNKNSGSMNDKINHEYTEEIVCPCCGCEFGDSWDLDADSGEEECYECGKEFEYHRHIEVTYCTYEITEEMKEKNRIRREQHRQRIEELLKQDENR